MSYVLVNFNLYAFIDVAYLSFVYSWKDFRNQMLDAISVFFMTTQNGLFINSCFAYCQSERQDTWFASDSHVIGNKVTLINIENVVANIEWISTLIA